MLLLKLKHGLVNLGELNKKVILGEKCLGKKICHI